MNATIVKQTVSKSTSTISNRIDGLARKVRAAQAKMCAAGQNGSSRLRSQYERAFKDLFEATLYRFIHGKVVPGAVGRAALDQAHDGDADLSGVLLKALKMWDVQRPFLHYFRVAVKNSIRDSHRRRTIPVAANNGKHGNGTSRNGRLRIVSLEAWSPILADQKNARHDNPEDMVDSAHRLRAAMTALFDSSPADTAFIWVLHHFGGLTYDQIADRMNRALVDWSRTDGPAGRLIPFYRSACLRKRMERFLSTIESAIQSDERRAEAIKTFLETEDPTSIGYLSDEKIDELISAAKSHLQKMETRISIVAETVDAYARQRHLRLILEESLSQESRTLVMGRIPSFAFESPLWKKPGAAMVYSSVLADENILSRIRTYLASTSSVSREIPSRADESDHLTIFLAIVAA